MYKKLRKLIPIITSLFLVACVASVDPSLPYTTLPESIVATEVSLVASPAHPTATLSFDPIKAGETVQILGTDPDAAWLLVLHNGEVGWMPTVFSRTNIGDIQTAFTFDPLDEKCNKYIDATTDLSSEWKSTVDGSLLVLGSIYRAQTATPFDNAQLEIDIEGSGTVVDSDYLHTPLTASSSIVFFTFAINDLQKVDQIRFQAENAGDEPLAFQALYFSDECRADFQRLPIGRLKTVETSVNTSSRSETASSASQAKTPVIIHGNYIWSVRASNIDDAAAILVNGKMVAGGLYANGRGQTDWVDITEQMVPGEDTVVTFVSLNGGSEGAWGFFIRRGNTIIWGQESEGGAEYTMQYAKTVTIKANGEIEEAESTVSPRASLPGHWLVQIQDIDDIGIVLVNGQPMGGACQNCSPNENPRSATIDISSWLDASRDNVISIIAWNLAGEYSYRFALEKDDDIYWQQDKRAEADPGVAFSEIITITSKSEIQVASSLLTTDTGGKQKVASPEIKDGKCNVIPAEKCIYSEQFDGWSVGMLEQLTSGDSWASFTVGDPEILYYADKFHLWFAGRAAQDANWSIGHATSLDGIDWEVESAPILTPDGAETWEGTGIGGPSVIVKDGIFEMYYHGGSPTQIGLAISKGGINWEKSSRNPVLAPSPTVKWMGNHVIFPSVIYRDDTYKMWFAATGGANWQDNWQIGYAESTDGVNWLLPSDQPVISLGSASSWKSQAILAPNVLMIDDTYHMWYAGRTNPQAEDWRIGHATSPDGLVWIEDFNNPVFGLGSVDGFASGRVSDPSIAVSREGYHLWYTGTRAGEPNSQIGLATSKDGVRWLR